MIKLIANLCTVFAVLLPVYLTFYFRVIPRLVDHYRTATRHRRKYDEEIREILKEEEK